MGKIYEQIEPRLAKFIEKQHVFFVATAPTALDGHVNVSPKGLDTLAILGPTSVAYLDLTGSGIETIAHLRDNGRIVVMFCAFEGPPRILRLYGRGEVIEASDPEFEELSSHFQPRDFARAVIRVEVERIATSCGYAVPILRYDRDREILDRYWDRKADELLDFRREKNERSIDGLPGLVRV